MATFNKRNWVNGQQPAINDTNLNALENDIQLFGNAILQEAQNDVIPKLGYEQYSNTSTYEVGDYCVYNNNLYICNTAISNPEDFIATKWTLTSVAEIIKDIDEKEPTLTNFDLNISSYTSAQTVAANSNKTLGSKTLTLTGGKYLVVTSPISVRFSQVGSQCNIDLMEGSNQKTICNKAYFANNSLNGDIVGLSIVQLDGGTNTYSWRIRTGSNKTVTIEAYQSINLFAIKIGS